MARPPLAGGVVFALANPVRPVDLARGPQNKQFAVAIIHKRVALDLLNGLVDGANAAGEAFALDLWLR